MPLYDPQAREQFRRGSVALPTAGLYTRARRTSVDCHTQKPMLPKNTVQQRKQSISDNTQTAQVRRSTLAPSQWLNAQTLKMLQKLKGSQNNNHSKDLVTDREDENETDSGIPRGVLDEHYIQMDINRTKTLQCSLPIAPIPESAESEISSDRSDDELYSLPDQHHIQDRWTYLCFCTHFVFINWFHFIAINQDFF